MLTPQWLLNIVAMVAALLFAVLLRVAGWFTPEDAYSKRRRFEDDYLRQMRRNRKRGVSPPGRR
jgi:hypothetical protein